MGVKTPPLRARAGSLGVSKTSASADSEIITTNKLVHGSDMKMEGDLPAVARYPGSPLPYMVLLTCVRGVIAVGTEDVMFVTLNQPFFIFLCNKYCF
jgi:hypothetical protein